MPEANVLEDEVLKRMDTIHKAIFILGKGLKQDENGVWHTTISGHSSGPHDKFGPLGDRLRVVAGSFLFEENPKVFIIVSGGQGALREAPPLSTVMKRELIELGVPEEQIVEDSKPLSTYQQLQGLVRFVRTMKLKKVILISNEYHIPRIKTMISIIPEFRSLREGPTIQLQQAESILIQHDPKSWKDLIDRAYESEEMQERRRTEEQGIKDLREGNYILE